MCVVHPTQLDTIVGHSCFKDRDASKETQAALMINNLGATPAMELAVVARRALTRLPELGIQVSRFQSGYFMTALDMTGFSLTLLQLDSLTCVPARPILRGR